MHNHHIIRHIFLGALLLALLTACQPQPEQLVTNPTLAVLPTITPFPTATPVVPTFTPTITLTPSVTPTPTQTHTPRPTFTPVPDDPGADCAATLFAAVEAARFACSGLTSGQACYGSALVEAESQPNLEDGRILRRYRSTAFLADLSEVRTSMAPAEGSWGLLAAYLDADLNRQFAPDERIAALVYGGTTLQNLVDHPQIQRDFISTFNVQNAPDFVNPFSRLQITAQRPPTECRFVPYGVLFQATDPSVLEINGVQVSFNGTIHVTGFSDRSLDVTNLDGDVELRFLERRDVVVTGITASVPINDVLEPIPGNVTMLTYDRDLQRSIFDRAAPLLDLLPRPVTAPPFTVPDEEIMLMNSYTGSWTFTPEITFLAGLYEAGDEITPGLQQEVAQVCAWGGAALLGTDGTRTLTIQQDLDDRNIAVDSLYPDMTFPALLARVPGDTDMYTGTAIDSVGTVFEHEFLFTSPTSLEWRVDLDILGGSLCRQASVRGTAIRVAATPAPVATALAGLQSGTWQVQFGPTAGTVPQGEPLADCPEAAEFAPSIPTAVVGLVLDAETGSLSLSGNVPGLTVPALLVTTARNPNSFIGVAEGGEGQAVHEISFEGEDQLRWRVMLRSPSGACRLGTLEAVGIPLGG